MHTYSYLHLLVLSLQVGNCEFKRQDVGADEVSCMAIKSESEQDLQSAVATQGPISVGIDASQSSFQFYR